MQTCNCLATGGIDKIIKFPITNLHFYTTDSLINWVYNLGEMKRLLTYLFLVLGLILGGCASPGGNPVLNMNATSIIETNLLDVKNCKMIKTSKVSFSYGMSTEDDIRYIKIKLK